MKFLFQVFKSIQKFSKISVETGYLLGAREMLHAENLAMTLYEEDSLDPIVPI
jgi:hypothetical protein